MVKVISHYLEQKHAGVDAITYTGQKCLKDQASADKSKFKRTKQKVECSKIKLPQNNKSINEAQLVFFWRKNRRKMIIL
mgnify:CR=1 FL=1